MKKGLILAGIIIGLFIMIVIVLGGTFLSARNTEITLDEQIKARYTANQSNYDNMWKRFKEMTQVSDLQANQMKDVYTDLITGRYKDSGKLFQMVKEQNPQLDTKVYTKLQNEISAGRKEFDNNQKAITDMIREYNTYVRKHFISAMIFNWQPKNMNDFIITSERTQKAFEDKKDDVINLKGE